MGQSRGSVGGNSPGAGDGILQTLGKQQSSCVGGNSPPMGEGRDIIEDRKLEGQLVLLLPHSENPQRVCWSPLALTYVSTPLPFSPPSPPQLLLSHLPHPTLCPSPPKPYVYTPSHPSSRPSPPRPYGPYLQRVHAGIRGKVAERVRAAPLADSVHLPLIQLPASWYTYMPAFRATARFSYLHIK